MRELATKANKDPNSFKAILLTYPNVSDSKNSGDSRLPMTGTVEEVGSDMREMKDMGIEHIIFGVFFSPIYRSIDQTLETAKQLMQYAK